MAAAQGLAAASLGTKQLLAAPPAAQGLHGLQAPAAQGLHGLQPPAAHGLHPLAAHGLHGLQPPAAQGLHGLQAASWMVEPLGLGTAVGLADPIGRGTAVGFAAPMPRPLDAALLGPASATTMPTPAISGTTALDRSFVFIACMSFLSLVVPLPTRAAELPSDEIAEPNSE